MIVLAIIATLAAIAVPSYHNYLEKMKVSRAISEVKILESEILVYFIDNGVHPDNLAVIGRDNFLDPWGNPYQYLKIAGADLKGNGKLRKDHAMVPVNSDYDLYSMGADGKSQTPFTAEASQDDIVRCEGHRFSLGVPRVRRNAEGYARALP